MRMMGPPPNMHGGPRGPRGFLTDEEKAHKPKITRELIFRILGSLRPYKLHLLLVFASIAISSVLALLPAILTGKIVDAIISDKTNVKKLLELVSSEVLTAYVTKLELLIRDKDYRTYSPYKTIKKWIYEDAAV